ncbi:MAG: translocation/assembly module TamB [Gemmatimonadetes bacterium]|nr:translocation/assembly module TamB [Gemmatimonadota bacterium]
MRAPTETPQETEYLEGPSLAPGPPVRPLSHWSRAALLLAGSVLGLLLAAVALWVYVQTARDIELRTAVGRELGLPADAFGLETLPEGRARVSLQNVALLGPAGDTIVSAPLAYILLDQVVLTEGEPVVIPRVELLDPFLRLVQQPDGEWNLVRAVALMSDGQEVQMQPEGEGRTVLLSEVLLRRGRLLLSTLDDAGERTVRTARGVDARLANVRVGGAEGWRVEVADLNAILENPEVRIAQLRGWVEEAPEDGFRFAIETLRTDLSTVEGEGLVRLAEEGARFDLALRAEPLDLRDLRWLAPDLPLEGQARLALAVQTRADGRTEVRAREVAVTGFDSRVTGYLAMLVGGEAPPVFLETNLLLDPLDLRILDVLGVAEQYPYAGTVRGTLATLGGETVVGGPLQVDLTASVIPRGVPGAEPSILGAEGALAMGGEEDPLVLQELQIQLRPLRLEALVPLLPEQRERLQGVIRGTATLAGTPRDLRLEGGELAYEVGAAPPSRLAALSGRVRTEPELRYELRAVAQPLALPTLTELFPALPFRTATLAGPVEVTGTREALSFSVDLGGDAGLFAVNGQLAMEEPLRFDVSGMLSAFQPAGLLLQATPTTSAVSGTFAAAGTVEDLRFDVDLAQAEGSFALEGRIRTAAQPPQVEVAGQATNFQLGTVIGRPTLFASPVSGPIRVNGGGASAYRFDLGLRSDPAAPPAALAVEGWYTPGDLPSYALSGVVAGVNLRQLPGAQALPTTNLTAGVQLEGRGITLETLDGRLSLTATGSTIGGESLEAATAELAVRGGILRVDTLALALRGNRLAASGQWGLQQPAPAPLRFSLASPDLASLTPVLISMRRVDIQLAGALTLEGWLAGSLENPALAATGRGRNLRYNGWRAGTLALQGEARREVAGWSGQGNVSGSEVTLAGTETLQTVRLEVDATPTAAGVGVLVRRDAQTELATSAILEFTEQQQQLRGIEFENLALRLGPSRWQLAAPTHVRWGEVEGLEVDSLVLRRTDAGEGWIEVDGRMPPTGATDFRLRLAGVDLGELRRLAPQAQLPEIEGMLALEAFLEGPVGAPELAVEARLSSLRFEGASADTLTLSARYAAGQLVSNAALWLEDRQTASLEATVPMTLSIEGLVPEVELLDPEPLQARIMADSLPLGLLVAAVPQARAGEGVVSAQIEVGGTLGRPDMTGTAAVRGGAITLPELGVRYEEIEARLQLAEEQIQIQSLTARSGGAAALSGVVRIDDRTRPELQLAGSFNQFRGMNRADVANIAVSGQISLSGRLPNPVLTGRVVLSDGTIAAPIGVEQAFEITDIEIGEIGADIISPVAVEPTIIDNIRIEGLEVVLGDGVVATSPELRVQIGGELLVSRRDVDTWQIFGDLQAQRGTYALTVGPIVREFDVVSGRIQFFGTPDLNPALNIVAAHRVRQVTAGGGGTGGQGAVLNILVEVSGTAQFPRLRLTSDTRPPLPESELLSYLIFGRPTFALGEVGGGLAQQLLVQELVGGVLLAPLEQWLRQAGLFDYVRVRGRPSPSEIDDPLGSTTVEVGWQLGRNVFWTVEWGVGVLFGGQPAETWGSSLEWQIDPQWSARVANEPLRRDLLLQRVTTWTTGVTRQWSVDLRRRWEYGRPRVQEPREPLLIPGEAAEPAVEVAPQPPESQEDSEPNSRNP